MSLIKLANMSEERKRFLEEYHVRDKDVFLKDPIAKEKINTQKDLATKQIDAFFKMQEKNNGGLTPEMQSLRTKMIADLDESAPNAIRNFSIDRTRAAASTNPSQFKEFNQLSEQSDVTLGKSHGREVGGTLGAIGGAGIGLLAGRKLPKKTKGILQQVGGTSLGGLTGGFVGSNIGANRDEKRTGFNHEDILAPYEIADRMENRKNFG